MNLRLVHSQQDIEDTFCHWTKDPIRLARLYRWLSLMGEQPRDIPAFLENPIVWRDAWVAMCEFEGKIA